MGWETRLGVWATVTAVLVAVWALISSSRTVVRERRADFYLEQLAEIALIVEKAYAHGELALAARVRMLPEGQFAMPVVRAWARRPLAGEQLAAELERGWQEQGAPTDFDGLGRWLREQGQAEVNAGVEHVLQVRRGWWERLRGRVRRRRVTVPDRF
ncbi:hypothetical protein [Kitasatospora cineracea]|uniref:Uncharacterized protein n=1 Tax=Kitasatospora cineracea TaxID=88074 RepID=A0A3N4R8G1_9ACTN|nr:hypothetical protein [Kitasatospora cineracea]RPE27255.1 hypothetical protein EDD38_7400 [Kitasatospora cineracea]